jgi:hypothetical protein
MLARVGLVAVAITGAMTTMLGVAPWAAAEQDDAMRCDYTMTDPVVVDVNGAAMVTSSLDPAACTGDVHPIFAQVCVAAPGSAGRCSELSGYASPKVYVSPYVPGTTYTAWGRGCATTTNPSQPICTTLGPRSVTL